MLGKGWDPTTLLPSVKMYFNIIIADSFQYVTSIIAAVNYKVNCLCTALLLAQASGRAAQNMKYLLLFN